MKGAFTRFPQGNRMQHLPLSPYPSTLAEGGQNHTRAFCALLGLACALRNACSAFSSSSRISRQMTIASASQKTPPKRRRKRHAIAFAQSLYLTERHRNPALTVQLAPQQLCSICRMRERAVCETWGTSGVQCVVMRRTRGRRNSLAQLKKIRSNARFCAASDRCDPLTVTAALRSHTAPMGSLASHGSRGGACGETR
eukprot:scaffold986_cov237-Pinguiococcus_pyrenoidosus.AAC.14